MIRILHDMGINKGIAGQGRRGMALVFVLLVMSILTAMVADFSYELYVNTSLLNNWQRLQEISLTAGSGASLAGIAIPMITSQNILTKVFPVPPMDPFELGIDVSIIVEMESAKFNVNTLIDGFGKKHDGHLEAFVRMLEVLELDPMLGRAILHYIDTDSLDIDGTGAEANAKNAPLQSVEELLLVAGVDREVYNILLPHVTIYGNGDININLAEPPVLKALFQETVSLEMVEGLVDHRAETHFVNASDYQKANEIEAGDIASGMLSTVDVTHFKVTSLAIDKDGLRREITCVMDKNSKIEYWKEM